MKEQLLKLLAHYKKSATKFSDEIGVQRSSISHIMSGRNLPSYDFILKIMNKYPELNVEWLLTGKGEMIKEHTSKNSEKSPDLFYNVAMQEEGNKTENTFLKNTSEAHKEQLKENQLDNVTNVNTIEKIVFFHKNGTFRAYQPE